MPRVLVVLFSSVEKRKKKMNYVRSRIEDVFLNEHDLSDEKREKRKKCTQVQMLKNRFESEIMKERNKLMT